MSNQTIAAKAIKTGTCIDIRYYTGPADGVTVEGDTARVHTPAGTFRFKATTRIKLAA